MRSFPHEHAVKSGSLEQPANRESPPLRFRFAERVLTRRPASPCLRGPLSRQRVDFMLHLGALRRETLRARSHAADKTGSCSNLSPQGSELARPDSPNPVNKSTGQEVRVAPESTRLFSPANQLSVNSGATPHPVRRRGSGSPFPPRPTHSVPWATPRRLLRPRPVAWSALPPGRAAETPAARVPLSQAARQDWGYPRTTGTEAPKSAVPSRRQTIDVLHNRDTESLGLPVHPSTFREGDRGTNPRFDANSCFTPGSRASCGPVRTRPGTSTRSRVTATLRHASSGLIGNRVPKFKESRNPRFCATFLE